MITYYRYLAGKSIVIQPVIAEDSYLAKEVMLARFGKNWKEVISAKNYPNYKEKHSGLLELEPLCVQYQPQDQELFELLGLKEIKRMAFFNTCPKCGANLDPGEKCDCDEINHKHESICLPFEPDIEELEHERDEQGNKYSVNRKSTQNDTPTKESNCKTWSSLVL